MTIEDVLEELGVEYIQAGEHHHARSGWIQIDCPFCGPGSRRFHLGWNLHLNYTNCWKCGAHFPDQILIALGVSKRRAWEIVSGLGGRSENVSKPAKSLNLPAHIGPLLSAHKKYLKNRGFDPKYLEQVWNIKGIGIDNKLPWRIFIPILFKDQMVSWTTRAIGNAKRRYISARADQESVNHKHLIYGQDYCHHSIVIVEGPIDAWRVGPGAGALFGIDFTTAQVNKIIQHPYRFVVFDTGAQNQASKLANQLSAFPGKTEVIYLDADDPGSASDKEIRLLRRIARL